MSFAFDFQIPSEADEAVIATSTQENAQGRESTADSVQGSHQDDNTSGSGTPVTDRPLRQPFVWLKPEVVQQLLEQACEIELTCRELTVKLDPSNAEPLSQDPEDSSKASDGLLRWVVDMPEMLEHPPLEGQEHSQVTASTTTVVDQTSVVKPGVYEGGLQVWECSLDLVRYLHQCLFWKDNNSPLSGKPQHTQYEDMDPRNLPELVDGPWLQSLLFGRSHNNEEEPTTTTTPPTEPAGHAVPKILELGCGHALPSIYLLRQCWLHQQGLKQESMKYSMQRLPQLHVCEYNTPVISTVTIPNLVLNVLHAMLYETPGYSTTTMEVVDDPESKKTNANAALTREQCAHQLTQSVHVGTGDWLGLVPFPSNGLKTNNGGLGEGSEGPTVISDAKRKTTDSDELYDLILAAETLYTLESAQETCHLLARWLKPETGMAYLATKRYYFGVGGGTQELWRVVETNYPNLLTLETIRVYDNGVSNIRELVRVRKQSHASPG